MLATKPRPKPKAKSHAKPTPRPWRKAHTIRIPIRRSGTKFRQYPDAPPRPCVVTACIQIMKCEGRWAWRYDFDSPYVCDADPQCDKRRTVTSEEAAVAEACKELMRQFEADKVIRIRHKQTEAAAALANAIFDVRAFLCNFEETGSYLTTTHRPADTAKNAVPAGKPAKPARSDVLDSEINDFVERRTGKKNPIQRTAAVGSGGLGRGLALPAIAGAIDAPLDPVERRQLATLEKTIEKNAGAVFEFGIALKTIRDGRLYRATHNSFEAYCADRWGISKSDGHRQIQAAAKYEAAQPIAAKLGIRLTCESQMRPLARVADEDLGPVLKRVSHLVPKGDDGSRRVTAEVLARAVREETMSPDDIKRVEQRQREAARSKGHGAGSREAAAATPSPFTIPDFRQDAPAIVPVRSSPPETEVLEPQHVPPTCGVNLDFARTLDELQDYVGRIFRTFVGQINGETSFASIGRELRASFLAGKLKALSKQAVGIQACCICGCSETDPCDTEHGEGCSWVADDLCSSCVDRQRLLEDTGRRAE